MLGVNKLRVSERQMHFVRWLLTIGWLVVILSLFYDPISAVLTQTQSPFGLFRFDPNKCVLVQGECLEQQPASIALFLFWTIVVPSSIFILLVFGHDTWRRICPLSFLSQIPRALGIQRQRKSSKSGSGAVRYELVKIKKDSWLGRNHLYVQFGLLAVGLVLRLLLMNADRWALGTVSLLTIGAAIAVGYLYEGKSWCQYFCPMAPVQTVFTGPRGLLGSEAHQGQKQTVTQSMCRTVDKDGKEKSACVGCQSPCMDIDAERNYWETGTKPGRRLVHYGYVGLLLGFFFYTYLYAGNFDYLFTGAWMQEANPAAKLFQPGFYFAGRSILIPKIVAVPLTLALFVAFSYFVLSRLEKRYRALGQRSQKTGARQSTHVLFSICTFVCFNLFFFFGSQSLMAAFPLSIHLLFNGFIMLVSTLWLARTIGRSAELYSRESLAASLRRQLGKLAIDFSRFLEGRSMEDLKAEEVYVLAKVLPGFNQEQGLQVYKGVLREALEQGTTDSAGSLETLRQLRQELNIKDEDHFTVLTELGSAEPDLLDPKKRRTRESQLRIESYRQAIASTLLDLVDSGMSLQEAMQRQRKQIQFLKLEYGMTSEEEDSVLSQILTGEQATILRKASALLEQMQQLALHYQILSDEVLDTQTIVFQLLRQTAVRHRQEIVAKQMLGLLEVLGDQPEAIKLANSTRELAANVLPDILQAAEGALIWKQRLSPGIFAVLDRTFDPVRSAESPLATIDLTTANIAPEVLPPLAGSLPRKGKSGLPKAELNGHSVDSAPPHDSINGTAASEARLQDNSAHNLADNLADNLIVFAAPSLSENAADAADAADAMSKDAASTAATRSHTSDFSPLQETRSRLSQIDATHVDPIQTQSLTNLLEELLHDLDPLTQTLALYALNLLTPPRAKEKAQAILSSLTGSQAHWLIRETAQMLLDRDQEQAAEVQTLIIRFALAGQVEKHLFQQPVVRVGSSGSNDLVLDQPQVAPFHAVFYLEGEGYGVLDLGGSLQIDRHALRHDRILLRQGQIIQFGDAVEPTLTVNWEKQPLRRSALPTVISTLDKVLLLFESRFFRSLKPDALVELGRNAAVRLYAYGEQICQAGDPSDSILLLIDGTADVMIAQAGRQQIIGTVNRGETIGEMGVLTRQPRSASVIAASDDCRVLVIQSDKFNAVLRQDPEVSRNLLVVLSLRLQNMTHKMKAAAGA